MGSDRFCSKLCLLYYLYLSRLIILEEARIAPERINQIFVRGTNHGRLKKKREKLKTSWPNIFQVVINFDPFHV